MEGTYAKELTKQAVARACAALGIKYCRAECIDAFSDVIKHYIQSIGLNCRENAELSGRAIAGIQDVIPALEHTNPVSTKWHDLKTFAFSNEILLDEDGEKIVRWNQPFPFEVPNFPLNASFASGNQNLSDLLPTSSLPDPSIPSHLPPFPHSSTYKKTTSLSRKRGVNSTDGPGNDPLSALPEKKMKLSVKNARSSLAKLEDSADELALQSRLAPPSEKN